MKSQHTKIASMVPLPSEVVAICSVGRGSVAFGGRPNEICIICRDEKIDLSTYQKNHAIILVFISSTAIYLDYIQCCCIQNHSLPLLVVDEVIHTEADRRVNHFDGVRYHKSADILNVLQ